MNRTQRQIDRIDDWIGDAVAELEATRAEKDALLAADWYDWRDVVGGPRTARIAARLRLAELREEQAENARREKEYAQ